MAKTPRTWTGARTPSGLKRVRQADRRHEILQPRRLYERTGQADYYAAGVERLKEARAEFLSKFPSLSEEIVAASLGY